MNRTGTSPDKALELYQYCASAPGISIMGIHAYDGHIRDTDFAEKKKKCDDAFAIVEDLVKKIANAGLPKPLIIAGGSPTFSVHCKREQVECSPGTFIYWDQGYSLLCPEQEFVVAAILLTRVISFPAPGLICTDLGHKSVAAENEMSKRVFFPGHEHLHAVSQSEEHLVLQNSTVEEFISGAVLFGIPWHICPTVALYDSIKIIEAGRCVGEWKNVARDRKISI
jgi:D-serine deaminase-like pyridoxal phosphate-dependent protein